MKLVAIAVVGLTLSLAGADAQLRARPDRVGGRILRVDHGAAPLSPVAFLELQPAVDAARDGDLILVAPGQYDSVTVAGKSLAIVADGDGAVTVAGLLVEELDEHQTVLVRGVLSPRSMTVRDVQGAVWIEDCEIRKLFVRDTRSCVVKRSTLLGGLDARATWGLFLYECGVYGWNGGDGYACACGFFHECTTRYDASDGSPALVLEGTTALLWGCDLRGGHGGDGYFSAFFCCARAGDGAASLVARTGALATVVDSPLIPGTGGFDPCVEPFHGEDGVPVLLEGGEVLGMEGTARPYEASAVTRLEGVLTLSFEALPDDRPIVLRNTALLAQPGSSLGLPNLVALDSPALAFDPLLTGIKDVAVAPFPIGGADFGVFFTQVLYEVNSHGLVEVVPGPPSASVVLRDPCFDLPPVPDCNGNALADPCEIANGLSSDADGDGVPDECTTAWQLAGGPTPVSSSRPVDFVFPAGPRPSGPVRVRIGIERLEINGGSATFGVALNGVPLERVLAGSQASCVQPDADTFVVEAGVFETIAGSGDLVVTVTPPYLIVCSGAAVSVDLAYPTAPADCNGNFVPDAFDLSPRTDCDGNSVLDVCELRRRAGARSVPFNVYFPLDLTIAPPARSSTDVVVTIDSVTNSGGALIVNGTYVGFPIGDSCPNRRQRQVLIAKSRWNALVGDGPAHVRAQVNAPSASGCEDFGIMEVRWTDPALDCNGNGRLDSCDIASGASTDGNANGVPDECE